MLPAFDNPGAADAQHQFFRSAWRLGSEQWRVKRNMETTIVYWSFIRIMEKKMETTIVCWGKYPEPA